MPSSAPATTPRLTVLVAGPASPARATQLELAQRLAAAFGAHVRTCIVPVETAIGRDLAEADRVLALDWTVFAALPHLREMLAQVRGRTVLVCGASDPLPEPAFMLELRRFAGRVLTSCPHTQAALQQKLLAPVERFDAADPLPAFASAFDQPPTCGSDVVDLLREAQSWFARGDCEGAFVCAARALKLQPDQPGIVADVARLLTAMGRAREAEHCLRGYLLQRPDAPQVRAALSEVLALSGR